MQGVLRRLLPAIVLGLGMVLARAVPASAVRVQALICTCDLVLRVRVLQSVPMLGAAAVAAVRQWLFKPAPIDGKPIEVGR